MARTLASIQRHEGYFPVLGFEPHIAHALKDPVSESVTGVSPARAVEPFLEELHPGTPRSPEAIQQFVTADTHYL